MHPTLLTSMKSR